MDAPPARARLGKSISISHPAVRTRQQTAAGLESGGLVPRKVAFLPRVHAHSPGWRDAQGNFDRRCEPAQPVLSGFRYRNAVSDTIHLARDRGHPVRICGLSITRQQPDSPGRCAVNASTVYSWAIGSISLGGGSSRLNFSGGGMPAAPPSYVRVTLIPARKSSFSSRAPRDCTTRAGIRPCSPWTKARAARGAARSHCKNLAAEGQKGSPLAGGNARGPPRSPRDREYHRLGPAQLSRGPKCSWRFWGSNLARYTVRDRHDQTGVSPVVLDQRLLEPIS